MILSRSARRALSLSVALGFVTAAAAQLVPGGGLRPARTTAAPNATTVTTTPATTTSAPRLTTTPATPAGTGGSVTPASSSTASPMTPSTTSSSGDGGESAAFAPLTLDHRLFTASRGNFTTEQSLFSGGRQHLSSGDGSFGAGPPVTYTRTGPQEGTLRLAASDDAPARTTTLRFTSATGGTYSTVPDDGSGPATTGAFTLAALPVPAGVVNASVLTELAPDGVVTLGFVVAGEAPRRVLVRAVGRSLAEFGLDDGVRHPVIRLWHRDNAIADSTAWGAVERADDEATAGEGGATANPSDDTSSENAASPADDRPSEETPSEDAPDSEDAPEEDDAPEDGAPDSEDAPEDDGAEEGATDPTEAEGGASGDTEAEGGDAAGAPAVEIDEVSETATDVGLEARVTEPRVESLASEDLHDTSSQAGAFALAEGSQDAALVATLPPGVYAVQVTHGEAAAGAVGSARETGEGGPVLVEVYVLE